MYQYIFFIVRVCVEYPGVSIHILSYPEYVLSIHHIFSQQHARDILVGSEKIRVRVRVPTGLPVYQSLSKCVSRSLLSCTWGFKEERHTD